MSSKSLLGSTTQWDIFPKRCDGAVGHSLSIYWIPLKEFQRPVCGPCTRVPKDDECEYTDVHSRTKDLQATISRLKARIKDLENPNNAVPPMILTQPVASGSSRRSPPSPVSSIISGNCILQQPCNFFIIQNFREIQFSFFSRCGLEPLVAWCPGTTL